MSARRLLSPLVLALALLPASVADAGFAPTSETIFEAEQTSGPDIAIDAAGNSIVAWSDEKALGDPREAKARRLSAGGTLGPVLELAPGGIGAEPAVAMSSAGRAFVAWEARVLEADPDSVKGRWIEPDGTLGPLLTLVEGKAGDVSASYIDVVVDPAGVATVTWRNTDDGSKLAARRVQPDGALGALVPDVSGGGGIQDNQTVALPDGSTLAIWRSSGIYANVLDPGLGFGVPVKLSNTGAAQEPEIAVDSAGNAFVAWTAAVGENWGIFGRQIGPAGVSPAELTIDPLFAEFVGQVSVAADSSGDFVITWDRQNAKGEKTIVARGANLSSFTGPAQAISEIPVMASPGAFPVIFDMGLGGVAWKSGPGSGTSVLGRQIDPAGVPTAAPQELFARTSFNLISVASAPAIGAAAFIAHYPISGSAQGAVVRRFLASPACGDSTVEAAQGEPVALRLACAGAAIEAVTVAAGPKHGNVIDLDPAALSVTYKPKPGYTGGDSLTYTATNDGGTSSVARVTIKDTAKPKIKRYKVRLVLSESARVKVTIKRLVRVGGKSKLRKVGKIATKKASAKATLPVKGRMARQLAAGGRFRLVAVATDAAGNRSKIRKKALKLPAR